jgi:hypothetical protein
MYPAHLRAGKSANRQSKQPLDSVQQGKHAMQQHSTQSDAAAPPAVADVTWTLPHRQPSLPGANSARNLGRLSESRARPQAHRGAKPPSQPAQDPHGSAQPPAARLLPVTQQTRIPSPTKTVRGFSRFDGALVPERATAGFRNDPEAPLPGAPAADAALAHRPWRARDGATHAALPTTSTMAALRSQVRLHPAAEAGWSGHRQSSRNARRSAAYLLALPHTLPQRRHTALHCRQQQSIWRCGMHAAACLCSAAGAHISRAAIGCTVASTLPSTNHAPHIPPPGCMHDEHATHRPPTWGTREPPRVRA